MTDKTQFILQLLDTALAADDATSKELANVLTALRGPDEGSKAQRMEVKKRATGIIRATAFPQLAAKVRAGGDNPLQWTFGPADATSVDTHKDGPCGALSRHFRRHIEQAAAVLGLTCR